jgi:hypothetical protein
MHRAAVLLSLLLLTSCAPKTGGCDLTTNLCSCNRTSASTRPDCRDYDAYPVDDAKSDCTTNSGTFSQTASCPAANKLGTCKYTAGELTTYQRYYTPGVADATSAAVACAYYKANCFVLSGNALCDATWTIGS